MLIASSEAGFSQDGAKGLGWQDMTVKEMDACSGKTRDKGREESTEGREGAFLFPAHTGKHRFLRPYCEGR